LIQAPDDRRTWLLGFVRVELPPGQSQQVTVTADPRLPARYNSTASQWRSTGGTHRVAFAGSAIDPVLFADAAVNGRLFGRSG